MRLYSTAFRAGLMVFAFACGNPPQSNPDAGTPEEDAGPPDAGEVDAGHDAGSKPDAGPKDAGFGPFPVEQWCEMQSLARCFRDERCFQVSGDAGVAACRQLELSTCDQLGYTKAVDAGRLAYSAENAAACVNAHAGGTCTQEYEICGDVFTGLVSPDGGCAAQGECQAGAQCYVPWNTCGGRCELYRDVGQPCNGSTFACDPESGMCQYSQDAGANICVPVKVPGDACASDFGFDCGPQMYCIDRKCIPQTSGDGEPCRMKYSYYPPCEVEYFCRQEPVTGGGELDAGVCQRRVGLGGVCPGRNAWCMPGLRCSTTFATGTCIPLGGLGEVCTAYDDCQDHLYCRSETSRCTEVPEEGGDCSYNRGSSGRCVVGTWCDWRTYTCEVRGQAGDPCPTGSPTSCLSNLCQWGKLADGGNGFACAEPCSARTDAGF